MITKDDAGKAKKYEDDGEHYGPDVAHRMLKLEIVSKDYAESTGGDYLQFCGKTKRFALMRDRAPMMHVSLGDLDLERLGLIDEDCVVLSYHC
jgi:hypothetical protein